MTEALLILVKVSVGVLILAIGMGATVADITYVWRRPGLLLRSLLAMYVLVRWWPASPRAVLQRPHSKSSQRTIQWHMPKYLRHSCLPLASLDLHQRPLEPWIDRRAMPLALRRLVRLSTLVLNPMLS